MTDYIKRDDAMKIICSNCTGPCALVEKANNPCAAIKELVYLPSADVAPVRHGRWKPFDRTYGRSIFACSACGDGTDVPTVMGAPIFDYCPNCGARMDGEDDETD